MNERKPKSLYDSTSLDKPRFTYIPEMMSYTELKHLSNTTIDRLVPNTGRSIEDIESYYPHRKLSDGAKVTRVAPSPTGFMHLGVLYVSLISERIAHQSGGVFYLRIEDTDRKREVEGARELICQSLQDFGVHIDEGVMAYEEEKGSYGPYTQSQRHEIYHTYIRSMLENGTAYPCFMTSEELATMVDHQNELKVRPGYYGSWATWRDRSEEEVIEALDQGKPYVIRFRSEGDISKRITVHDAIRGDLILP